MEKIEYFNLHEFKKAKEISYANPYEGIKAYQAYLKKYPKDYSAYAYYVSLLIKINRLDDAEEALHYLEQAYYHEPIYKNDPNRARILYHNILYCKLKLLGYQNRVNELLLLYYNNIEHIKNVKKEVAFYYRKLNGDLDLMHREPNSYLFRQIIEYREDDFMENMKKHLADYPENIDNPNIFIPNFPIEEVIKEVKKNIPSDKRLCLGFFDNTYAFKLDGCGRENNQLVDYFKVVTFNDTSDIITMYPASDCAYFPYVDLNYMNAKGDSGKVKTMSQIDKFNKRYNRG